MRCIGSAQLCGIQAASSAAHLLHTGHLLVAQLYVRIVSYILSIFHIYIIFAFAVACRVWRSCWAAWTIAFTMVWSRWPWSNASRTPSGIDRVLAVPNIWHPCPSLDRTTRAIVSRIARNSCGAPRTWISACFRLSPIMIKRKRSQSWRRQNLALAKVWGHSNTAQNYNNPFFLIVIERRLKKLRKLIEKVEKRKCSFCTDVIESMRRWKLWDNQRIEISKDVFKNPHNLENFLIEANAIVDSINGCCHCQITKFDEVECH